MQYRKFGKTGLGLSALGFGCMRLPLRSGGAPGEVDEPESVRMIRRGIDGGINYVDTAWRYHGGESERILGEALRDGYRERVYLATKSPVWLLDRPEDFDRILGIQLEKLKTERIDFYLLHSLHAESFEKNVLKLGILKRMEAARAAGKIGYLGFSFHDDYDVFPKILDAYDWDFCQIQLNYVDIEHQAGLRGLEEACRRGMGTVIMEPLKGGRLAALKGGPMREMSDAKSPEEWGLDFAWNRPETGVVLSGMSDMRQVEENLEYAERSFAGMLKKEDIDMLMRVRKAYLDMILAPCTGCEYCLPCPAGIAIPGVLDAYNSTETLDLPRAKAQYDLFVETGASACLSCRKCESACPQRLPVSSLMGKAAELFGR